MEAVFGLQVPSPLVVLTAAQPVAPAQVVVLFAFPIWTLMFGGVEFIVVLSITVVEATVIPDCVEHLNSMMSVAVVDVPSDPKN